MSTTDLQIDNAVPNKGTTSPDPMGEIPRRVLANAVLKSIRDTAEAPVAYADVTGTPSSLTDFVRRLEYIPSSTIMSDAEMQQRSTV